MSVWIDDGFEVLSVVVQLSRADFLPNDVQVVNYDSKLRVVARQEVTSSAGVTSRREFTRELDVTRPLLRWTLRAVLQSADDACLWIAAVIMPTSASSPAGITDETASAAVDSVLPRHALPCHVELR